MTGDRIVHGRSSRGGEIVRYDKAGKWYVEYDGSRLPCTLGDAVLFATAEGAVAFLGRAGGMMFDARVRASREAVAAGQTEEPHV